MATYKKHERLGAGGQGQVFRGTRDDGLEVALKYLRDDADDDARSRFFREVRIQQTLSHPNIVPVLGCRLTGEKTPFFAMPLANENLRSRFAQLGASNSLAFSYYEQILSAMEYAHANGALHRDLKPDNILVMEGDRGRYPVVTDFGLGKMTLANWTAITSSGVGMGTAGYAAPEQWGNLRDADERCDIYSLGVILSEILTGVPPGVPVTLADLPNGLGYLVERCTQTRPNDRYQSISELRREFLALTSQTDLLQEPLKAIRRILAELKSKTPLISQDLAELDRLLMDNLDDEVLLREVLPLFSDEIIAAYLRDRSGSFANILRAYDDAVSGGLGFDYCDVVARMYQRLYGLVADLSTKRLLLARLLDMGVSHNRWMVMRVTVSLFAAVSNSAEAAMAREVLMKDPGSCRTLKADLLEKVKLPFLRKAIEEACAAGASTGSE